MTSGINVSIEELHGVAAQLEDASGVLHGHADMLAGISIPESAFGTFTSAHAEYVSDRQSAASAVRGPADRTAAHGADARNAAGSYVSGDQSGAASISALEV